MLRPKAMHAYHPDGRDQHGILITPPGEGSGELAELVDVTALCRRLAGLESAPDNDRLADRASVPFVTAG